MYAPSAISEARIQGAFGFYHLSWDGEIQQQDLPPPEIRDGPYVTFKAALRAARRKIRKDRRKLHEQIINQVMGATQLKTHHGRDNEIAERGTVKSPLPFVW
jgi:hypothetical protein